ncbi:MAG TPA: L,D-transpeptidase [Anaerolineales bacterium]|nr:L,D-transpeptidase [Anaerolineales bacterium]HNO30473.1 L,D-transpeptidase [Anaerolineales bacterium]
MSISQLSRRDFLKVTASGALGLILSELGLDRALAAPPTTQGLALWSGVPIYDAPFATANKIDLLGKDKVINLMGEAQGDYFDNPFNTTWYQVEGGYTYSGVILPVETKYQKPMYEIPAEGQLAEVSVPYSLAYLAPYFYAKTSHRIYYETTHWVKKVVITREEKSVWYEIYDKVEKKSYYVPSYNMRFIPNDELTQLSPEIPNADKFIHVDIQTQMVTAFEGQKMVLSVRCASGQRGTDTPKGEWFTYHKGPSIHMTNQGDEVAHIYNLPGVPWCSFFTGSGHAFHGTYWHNDFGRPRSNGCINLPSSISKWVYRWTSPTLASTQDYVNLPGQGTRVLVE